MTANLNELGQTENAVIPINIINIILSNFLYDRT